MGYQSEAQLENQLVEQLSSQKYDRVSITDEKALKENFKQQFSLFNADKLSDEPLTLKEWERIFVQIKGHSVYQSAKILRDKLIIQREDGTDLYLRLLSEDMSENIFQVTNQVTMVGKYTNRYDVTLLVNGLPLVQLELKRRGIAIKEAFNQVERYRKHSYKGLYRFIQIFIISNGVDTKYFANSDKDLMFSLTFFWTDKENLRLSNLSDFTRFFLEPYHLIKMLTQYTIINDTDKLLMIMRPYQVFATEAIVRRAQDTNLNGYVWHTTGSGKTLTSFKTAQILANNPHIKKVMFIVDRKDLDGQTTQEFNKFEKDSVDTTSSTGVLVKQMKDKTRKLMVTTIQKLAIAVKEPRYAKVLDEYKDEKVILIFDESHRSVSGDMMKDIRKHFAKSQIFGFTGTPRFAVNKTQDGRTTADIFDNCLHYYLIKEAISDHNVLGFQVEYISTFKGQYDEDDPTQVPGIDTDELYNDENRVSLVANHIVQNHHRKTRNKQYTAIFTSEGIPALIKYYDEFNTIDHDFKIAAIFSYGANEDAEGRDEHSRDALERMMQDYNRMFKTNFSTETFAGYHSDVSKRVKNAQIDILMVVDMFLTGFDSKPLSTLYVDKNLKYHNLLQAFSRTNRVEKTTKPFGNIVCYRNLKTNTDEAIRLYSQTDNTDDVLMKPYEFYLEKFNELIDALREIAPTPASVDGLQSENDKKEFIQAFKQLSKMLLILKTFVDFNFDKDEYKLKQQEYEDYKSKYFDIYDVIKHESEKVSILNDIDFEIDLMESDKINVAYIMNLIRSIDTGNDAAKKNDIDNIKVELDRTDNPHLRKKVELIKAFLDNVMIHASGDVDVDELFDNFEDAKRNEEIETFATEQNLDANFLREQISEYEFTSLINKDEIRDGIKRPLKFFEKRTLIDKVIDFIRKHVDKYQ
jgi:type I restriction enzyme R subunit